MAIVRTAKGTAKASISGSTLVSETSIQCDEGDLLIVGVGTNHLTPEPTSVKWGNKDLGLRPGGSQTNVGGRRITYWILHVANTDTRDITATWAATNPQRAMIILTLKGAGRKDVVTTAIQDASTTPTTGATPVVMGDEEMAIAFMISDGDRTTDAAGTPQNSFTLGQRVGTTGLDMREYYRDLTGMTPLATVTCSLTGVTSRDWTSGMIVFTSVVTRNTIMIIYAEQYEKLIDSTDSNKQNAILIYLHGYYYNQLPAIPSDSFLAEINITQTDYDNGVALLESLGVIDEVVDGNFNPNSLDPA